MPQHPVAAALLVSVGLKLVDAGDVLASCGGEKLYVRSADGERGGAGDVGVGVPVGFETTGTCGSIADLNGDGLVNARDPDSDDDGVVDLAVGATGDGGGGTAHGGGNANGGDGAASTWHGAWALHEVAAAW